MSYRSEVVRSAIQFTILTLARSGSIRLAEWQEIDWIKSEWNIPADHMKMGKLHIVPLSKQALKVLEYLKPFTGDSRLIFYTTKKDKIMSENAMLKGLEYMGWSGKTTMHGFRALGSSVLNDAGFNELAVERHLAHADKNEVAASYRYMAAYMEERARMSQWWADFLDDQLKQSKIISLVGRV